MSTLLSRSGSISQEKVPGGLVALLLLGVSLLFPALPTLFRQGSFADLGLKLAKKGDGALEFLLKMLLTQFASGLPDDLLNAGEKGLPWFLLA